LAAAGEAGVPRAGAAAGDVLASCERSAPGPVRVEVLWPPRAAAGSELPAGSRCLVARIACGARAVLLASDLDGAGQAALLASGTDLRADVLVAPGRGQLGLENEAFRDAVGARVVVLQGRPERNARRAAARAERWYARPDVWVVRTDRSGAVTVSGRRDRLIVRSVMDGQTKVLP
jgi:competence protein ComEC